MEMNLWFWILGLVLLAGLAGWWLRRDRSGQSLPTQPAVREEPSLPGSYSPKNVGNDASARPWEQQSDADAAATAAPAVGATVQGTLHGFDADAFLESSRSHFIRLQAAWDRGDVAALRAMMTPEMLAQVQPQLAERERQSGAAGSQSEVVMLEAKLLGVEELEREYLASVEFSGLIRDEPSAGPNPFREIWNITRPRSGGEGWLVAGVQALQ
jgi:predicted lipid-binding transport protein (Tim44 family)